jgi:malonyl-CoA/methylmalonyl-CoA synthetase
MSAHFLNELRATFAECSRRPAVACQGRTLTFADLDQYAERSAAMLQRLGLRRGDRVALWTGARLPFLVAHFGILYAGGVSLPLNPRLTREEMHHFLANSGARLIVVGEEQQLAVAALRGSLPELEEAVPDTALFHAPAATFRPSDPAADDPCLLMYSSGTTGWPKGVVHTHANLAHGLRALQRCWRIGREDRVVNMLPLFHIHGLSFAAHLSLLAGGCVLLEEGFHAQQALDAIGRGTVFMAVPTMYYRLLEEPAFAAKAASWPDTRLFTCGSAPIRPEVLPKLEEILRRPVINRYGMTEACVITSLPLEGPWPAGSVGLPLGGVEVQVVAESGSASAGEVGRVLIRGPNLFREYWRNAEATRKAFATGWFDTGDLGALDAAGFLTLAGRSNDLIITHGYNVYPQVVERVISACPGVGEVAVLGIPDNRRGEAVVAAVVRGDLSLDEARLRTHWEARLVDYQQPRRVVFVEELPRNAMGKVLRSELRKLFEA